MFSSVQVINCLIMTHLVYVDNVTGYGGSSVCYSEIKQLKLHAAAARSLKKQFLVLINAVIYGKKFTAIVHQLTGSVDGRLGGIIQKSRSLQHLLAVGNVVENFCYIFISNIKLNQN